MEKRIKPNGNLELALDGDSSSDREFLEDLLIRTGGDDCLQLAEILEYTGWQPNGQLYPVRPEDVGALTEAPILSNELVLDDTGVVTEVGDIWWFPDYMLKNFVEVLLEKGCITFEAAPS